MEAAENQRFSSLLVKNSEVTKMTGGEGDGCGGC